MITNQLFSISLSLTLFQEFKHLQCIWHLCISSWKIFNFTCIESILHLLVLNLYKCQRSCNKLVSSPLNFVTFYQLRKIWKRLLYHFAGSRMILKEGWCATSRIGLVASGQASGIYFICTKNDFYMFTFYFP